jgi:dipeptidyl aminopeptidase/acylaminoacyl peptidase
MLAASDSNADYFASGFLVYGQAGTLVAHPFDLDQFRVTGEPFPVADRVQRIRDQTYLFSSALNHDVLVFGSEEQAVNQLTWYKRDGARLGSIGEPVRTFTRNLSLSPDEKRLAWHRVSPETEREDVWVGELATGIFTRLTSGSDEDYSPVWSPDGHALAFTSDRGRLLDGGGVDLYRKPAGGGAQELLFASDGCKFTSQWLHDGSILFETGGNSDFYLLPPSGKRKPLPLFMTEFFKNLPSVSADGRWVAYQSDESGRSEIYVAAFPPFTHRRRVSNGGGCQPRWRKDGKELFYLTVDGKMMSVDVRGVPELETSTPTVLFEVPFRVRARFWNQYSVTGDGQRFIFAEPVERSRSVNVVLNWTAGLKR